MHRRHFLRLSGGTLGALICTPWSGHAAPLMDTLLPPAKVIAVLDDGEQELQASGGDTWTYRDVVVKYITTRTGTRVELQSPTLPLRFIRLDWTYPLERAAAVLGDHWERTYGDMGFHPQDMSTRLPWYFIATDGKSSTCIGVKTGCPVIAWWQTANGALQLHLDTRNGGAGVLLGQRTLKAVELVVTRTKDGENVYATGRRFCHLLCEKPRLPKLPVYGINDWYYAYGNNSPALILKLTGMMADLATDAHNRPFSLIDAGWARYSPALPDDGGWMDDFSQPNEKFRIGMDKVAADIRKLGMRPGIWTRPLCARHDDPATLLSPSIPGRDDPKYPTLDPTIPENVARIQRNFRLYKQWGYEMIKHDFTTYDMLGKWGSQMKTDITTPGWNFHDRSRTTAEIALDLYSAIREAAGPDIYIIGCNTFSHLGAGIFELSRVGDDTSGKEWDRTRKMGVNTLGFRMIQHENFYAADGDCVGLTKDIPWAKNKKWMELIANSGTPLFISPQPEAIGDDQRQHIRTAFARAARKQAPGEPLDWLTTAQPAKWKFGSEIRTFDWS